MECNTSNHLIRVPIKNGDERRLWIESISNHQPFDFYRLYFNVCERHFAPCELTKFEDKTIRKRNAIPSIFDSPPPPSAKKAR